MRSVIFILWRSAKCPSWKADQHWWQIHKTSAQIKATLLNTVNILESPCADRDACHTSKLGRLNRESRYYVCHKAITGVSHKMCVIHCQRSLGKKRPLSSGEGKIWMASQKRRTQIDLFFRRGRTLRREKIMSKLQDTLHPRRLSTQNSPGTRIKVGDAQVQAWKNWARAWEGSPSGIRRLWNLRSLNRWLPRLEIYIQ